MNDWFCFLIVPVNAAVVLTLCCVPLCHLQVNLRSLDLSLNERRVLDYEAPKGQKLVVVVVVVESPLVCSTEKLMQDDACKSK